MKTILKDLIVVSAHCPTPSKEEKLENLIDKLQGLRNNFDVLVVSHSPVKKEIQEKVDHFYYDSNNEILRDFDLSYLAWFENESFFIETSLVYNMTTALAIARQVRYSVNFSNFWGYKKIHYMEYDFVYPGDHFILENNLRLDQYDTVMLNHPLNTGLFASSVYFSFVTKGLEEESREFNRERFLERIRNSHYLDAEVGKEIKMTNHGRMTENLNVLLFSQSGRKILYLPNQEKDQTEDSHQVSPNKWAFPVYDQTQNSLLFFIQNTTNSQMRVEVKINGSSPVLFECPRGCWTLSPLSDFEGDKEIEIWIEDNLEKEIKINSSNREKFIKNSFINYK